MKAKRTIAKIIIVKLNNKERKEIMKKICMTLVAALFAVCASAQVYLGGNVGIASVDNGGDDDVTLYSLLPEVGYKFNDNWAAGVLFGWSKGSLSYKNNDLASDGSTTHTFEINPYARFTFLHGKLINVFCDGGFGYKHYNGLGDQYSIGLKPGVELKLDKFSLVAHVGFLGYQKADLDHGGEASIWGMDFDGNNISLGVYYNF